MTQEEDIIINLLQSLNKLVLLASSLEIEEAIRKAETYLKGKGYVLDGLTGETWIKN
jgi:hypothetical protein